jgi:hypothetical protein
MTGKASISLMGGLALLCVSVSSASGAVLVGSSSPGIEVDASSDTDTIDISGGGALVSDVNIILDFTKCDSPISGSNCVGAGTPFFNEIEFDLTSPEGTTVSLIAAGTHTTTGSPGPGGQYILTLDDEAASPVGAPVPASGSF